MEVGIGVVGLLVVVFVVVVVFRLLKSLAKAMLVGLVLLALFGAWLAYSLGLFG